MAAARAGPPRHRVPVPVPVRIGDSPGVIHAMSRRHKPARPPAAYLDHGTAIRLARGDVAVSDRADPDSPNRTVRGARAVAHYTAMNLSETQREAADRLCVQAERAGGAAWRPDGIVVALHPSQRGHPAEWQVAAISDLRRAQAALGASAWGVAWACVVCNQRIRDAAEGTHARALLTGRLLAALDRLAEHWKMA